MARDERLHGRGRLETNLVRLPLAEGNDHLRDVRPFVGEALLGGFRTTIRLKQLDLMVLAFVLERCPGPGSPDTWVENVMMPNRARIRGDRAGTGALRGELRVSTGPARLIDHRLAAASRRSRASIGER